MVDKKHLWNLVSGNRAFLFTLDALVALSLVFIVIFASTAFVLRQFDQPVDSLQLEKIGADVVAVLDYRNSYDSLNKLSIDNKLRAITPENFDMRLSIECEDRAILIGDLPQKSFRSGDRIIVTSELDYCYVKYWIWGK